MYIIHRYVCPKKQFLLNRLNLLTVLKLWMPTPEICAITWLADVLSPEPNVNHYGFSDGGGTEIVISLC